MKRSPPKGGWFIDLVGGYKATQSCLLHPMFARWSLSLLSSSSSLSSSSYLSPLHASAVHKGRHGN